MGEKNLVILDFDKTITAHDTDAWVMEMMADEEAAAELRSHYRKLHWTKLINSFLTYFHENGTTVEDIAERLRKIPLVDGVSDLLKFLGDNLQKFHTVIMSDANTFHIETILEANGLDYAVAEIISNKGLVDKDGKLQVIPCHSHDHDICPVNMCKGVLIRQLLSKLKMDGQKVGSVSYIGDGSNDFCAAINLSPTDYVYPRAGFGLEKLIDRKNEQIHAEVVVWSDGSQIIDQLKQVIA